MEYHPGIAVNASIYVKYKHVHKNAGMCCIVLHEYTRYGLWQDISYVIISETIILFYYYIFILWLT